MHLSSTTLRSAKRLFARMKHLRCKLPVLNHLLLTAGDDGIRLAASDLDHWLETRLSGEPAEPACFLIPPAAMDAACRADRGSMVSFTPGGGRRSRELRLTLRSGGIEATSVHPTLDPREFPARPADIGAGTGTAIELPPATMEGLASVAGCASRDSTRHILNGVLFTPEDGGNLVATDGRILACCPAAVPGQRFVLPPAACAILGHPDFLAGSTTATWFDDEDETKRRVAFRCGPHLLVSRPLVGNYAGYKQVIPHNAHQMAVIPHDRRPGLIAWLRGIAKKDASVRLDWKKRGHLVLTHRDAEGRSDTLQIPVEIHGTPPAIAFHPRYLADALERPGRLGGAEDPAKRIPHSPSTARANRLHPLSQRRGESRHLPPPHRPLLRHHAPAPRLRPRPTSRSRLNPHAPPRSPHDCGAERLF